MIAGTLPFGLIARNAGVCCSPLLRIDGDGLVGQARFLEKESDLRRIRRRMKIEADHWASPSGLRKQLAQCMLGPACEPRDCILVYPFYNATPRGWRYHRVIRRIG